MHFDRRELYLAADNEEQMNRWVTKLCAVCNLERQESNSPVQFDSCMSFTFYDAIVNGAFYAVRVASLNWIN